jgi:hypothetical protein
VERIDSGLRVGWIADGNGSGSAAWGTRCGGKWANSSRLDLFGRAIRWRSDGRDGIESWKSGGGWGIVPLASAAAADVAAEGTSGEFSCGPARADSALTAQVSADSVDAGGGIAGVDDGAGGTFYPLVARTSSFGMDKRIPRVLARLGRSCGLVL